MFFNLNLDFDIEIKKIEKICFALPPCHVLHYCGQVKVKTPVMMLTIIELYNCWGRCAVVILVTDMWYIYDILLISLKRHQRCW